MPSELIIIIVKTGAVNAAYPGDATVRYYIITVRCLRPRSGSDLVIYSEKLLVSLYEYRTYCKSTGTIILLQENK